MSLDVPQVHRMDRVVMVVWVAKEEPAAVVVILIEEMEVAQMVETAVMLKEEMEVQVVLGAVIFFHYHTKTLFIILNMT
jgi:alpha/beta superfamily hydrolase